MGSNQITNSLATRSVATLRNIRVECFQQGVFQRDTDSSQLGHDESAALRQLLPIADPSLLLSSSFSVLQAELFLKAQSLMFRFFIAHVKGKCRELLKALFG